MSGVKASKLNSKPETLHLNLRRLKETYSFEGRVLIDHHAGLHTMKLQMPTLPELWSRCLVYGYPLGGFTHVPGSLGAPSYATAR